MRRNRNFSFNVLTYSIQLVKFSRICIRWRLTAERRPSSCSIRSTLRLSTWPCLYTMRPGKSPGRCLLARARAFPLRNCLCVFRQSVYLTNLLFTSIQPAASGDEGTRTPDIRLAKAALSHLSYIPRAERGSGPDWIRTSDPCVISTVL